MTGQIVLVILLIATLFLLGRKVRLAKIVKHYDPEQLSEKMKKKEDFVLLDVRTAGERQNSLIKGSMHIPLQELRRRVPELRKHQGKEIVCYCRSGNRSLSAASILRKENFTVANLRGGLVGWNLANIKKTNKS